MKKFFLNERVRRVLRPVTVVLSLAAAVWHGIHAESMLRQSKEWKTSDPSLSEFFWTNFQLEAAVTFISLFAGFFAWHLFKPKPTAQE